MATLVNSVARTFAMGQFLGTLACQMKYIDKLVCPASKTVHYAKFMDTLVCPIARCMTKTNNTHRTDR